MQGLGLGAAAQRAERGTLTQCAEAGGIDTARRVRGANAACRASTQHAGAWGVDAWRGADAGPGGGGGQLEHRLALGAREGDGKWNPPTRV